MKKTNYLLALWFLLINAVLANAQNCNPKIMGKQSKDKLNYPNSLFLIKYYYENQYIGSKKELNTK